jgi:membrane protease YdiL (CAAX protease family)
MRSGVAVVVAAVVVTAASSYLAFRPERSGQVAFWLVAGAPAIALGSVAAAWARQKDSLREWLQPQWGDFTRGVVGAVLLFGVSWALARSVAPVGSPHEIWLVSVYSQLGDPRALRAHAPIVAVAVVSVVLAEEILWRGMVTQVLAQKVGSRTAWLWAAALYAIAYLPTAWSLLAGAGGEGGLNPVVVAAALGGGLLWGGMARAFGRLFPSVLAHALFDWAVVMMFPLWGVR